MAKSNKFKWLSAATQALLRAPGTVFTRQELMRILNYEVPIELRSYRKSQKARLELLQAEGVITAVFLFPVGQERNGNDPSFARYARQNASPHAIALSLRGGSYLSHNTAAFLHDLAPTTNTIYVNKEQGPKPQGTAAGLTQSAIDRAFSNKPRHTNYVFTDGTYTYVLLNGKHTANAGVEAIAEGQNALRVTTLARTIIDLAVRPQYAGGAQGVLDAVRRAIGRVSTGELSSMLRTLDYLYPYHQALGFYLERAGFPDAEQSPLREIGFRYDFYLEHQAASPVYDTKWRVHYPASLS